MVVCGRARPFLTNLLANMMNADTELGRFLPLASLLAQ